jgi:reactive intermediate/imine deaminase
MRQIIESPDAPAVIGCYSQAIKSGNTVYLSGQIPLDVKTKALVEGDITAQIEQVITNLRAVAAAAGGSLDAVTKLTVFLLDINNITAINAAVTKYFNAPYPARSTIQVAALPKNALVEIDAVMVV